MTWRALLVDALPFVYKGMNYVLKMATDMDFCTKVRPIAQAMGLPELVKQNPFFTVGGLEKSFTLDLGMGIADIRGRLTSAQRIHQASRYIQEEERTYGRLISKFENYYAVIRRKETEFLRERRRLESLNI